MFDFGWSELLLIVAVAVLAFGPKELPQIMRVLGRAARRLQYMRFAIQQQFDDLMRDEDLEKMRHEAGLKAHDAIENEADEAALALPPVEVDEKEEKKENVS